MAATLGWGLGTPTASSLFSAYASMSASIMLVQTMFNQVVPRPIQNYVVSTLRSYFQRKITPNDRMILVVDELDGMIRNELFDMCEIFLSGKVSSDTKRLKITKTPKDKNVAFKFAQSEKILDSFEGIELTWKFVVTVSQGENEGRGSKHNSGGGKTDKRYFELSFLKENKEKVVNSYIPHLINTVTAINNEKKVLKLHSVGRSGGGSKSVLLDHPFTFDKLALDPILKKVIIDDLDMFIRRKDFYRKVGKAWKRGYLLYGPPGTGKSSLIAAIANYIKFDVYDLQLASVRFDSDLRSILPSIPNRSVLVIEDIDCSGELPGRDGEQNKSRENVQFTLSGLLNFIDGLWSSCGEERIIIFTTNHKEKIDKALLRPGRMDMHIHMSYLTPPGFRLLASNYLGISDHNYSCFGEIEELIQTTNVTPAEVAEELMRSEDADICLRGVLNFLKRKKMESAGSKDEAEEGSHGMELRSAKRMKTITGKNDKSIIQVKQQ